MPSSLNKDFIIIIIIIVSCDEYGVVAVFILTDNKNIHIPKVSVISGTCL